MFCKKCGSEVEEGTAFCPKCGCSMNEEKQAPVVKTQESKAIGILSIVFGALGGFLGLLFGIVGLCTYKEKANRRLCVIGMCLFAAWIVIAIILYICVGAAALSAVGSLVA